MGSRFDTWLARPSTIRFLRYLTVGEPRSICRKKLHYSLRQRAAHKRSYTSTSFKRSEAKIVNTALPFQLSDFGLEVQDERHRYSAPRSRTLEAYRERQKKSWRRIMSGHPSGLGSFVEIRLQADVNSGRAHVNRLVDQPEYKHDLELWTLLLSFRERIDGAKGVYDVWRGMRARGIDLPTTGEHADIFWPAFVRCAVASDREQRVSSDMLEDLIRYARELKSRTSRYYSPLYNLVVGRHLRVFPMSALMWHGRLCADGLALPNSLVELAEDVLLSGDILGANEKFKRIYRKSAERNLYDRFINKALELQNIPMALDWHRFFVQHGDMPSNEAAAKRAIRELHELATLHVAKSSRNSGSHALPKPLDTSRFPALTRVSMNEIVGEVHGIKPKHFSDNFCARIIATRAFSVEFAIRSLSFLGVECIGALALRELGVRSASIVDFSNRIVDLKKAGVDVAETVFCRLLLRVAKDGANELYGALLESDQHPDTYEDASVQEKLLNVFLDNGQYVQAHLTLMAMSILNMRSSENAWNALLKHYAANRNYRATSLTLQQLQQHQIPLSWTTFKCFHRYFLPVRHPGKRPVQVLRKKDIGFDALDFVTNAAIYTQQLGTWVVYSPYWLELLKRYGMEHRFDDVERLSLWLVHFFLTFSTPLLNTTTHESLLNGVCSVSERQNSLVVQSLPSKYRRTLEEVLNKQTLQAFVAWSFRAASVRHRLRPYSRTTDNYAIVTSDEGQQTCEPWARGLLLLRKIKQMGYKFPVSWVKQALMGRLWILFGPAYSTLAINNEMRRHNHLSLAHYIKHANEVWEGKLFDIPSHYSETTDNASEAALMRQVFGRTRRISRKRREYVDVDNWLENSVGKQASPHEAMRQRRRRWATSSLPRVMSGNGIGPWRITSRRVKNTTLVEFATLAT